MNRILSRRRHSAPGPPSRFLGSAEQVEVSPPNPSLARENHDETLVCLKYGRLYGVISPEAYEAGKADLLTRM